MYTITFMHGYGTENLGATDIFFDPFVFSNCFHGDRVFARRRPLFWFYERLRASVVRRRRRRRRKTQLLSSRVNIVMTIIPNNRVCVPPDGM